MMNQLERECPNCGNSRDGGIILHELFCYDVYIVSALCPQNSKQRRIDSQIGEDIVKPLEERGYNCFHGSRNIAAGEFILQAMSYPITIIPLTIVPLFKDKDFSSYCNLLLRPDYLKRIMFLTFDSTRIDCPAVSKITVTISFKDEYLLPKLIETIKNKRREFPLEQRKITFELGQEHDPESTSSAGSDFHRLVEFRRSDRSRISFRPKPVGICSEENIVFLEDIKRLTAPKEILHYCHHKNEKISIFSAKVLTRLIKKDIITFYKKQDLQIFEKEVRFLIGGEYKKKYEMNNEFEKLYFWILAAAYLKIYQHNCTELKTHFKHVELKKLKSSKKPYDHLCQKTYHKLTVSVIERIKHWSTPLDHNKMYPRNLEKCLSFLDHETSSSEKDHAVKTMKSFLPNLPWDVKHIFVAIITEKIFQKKFEESAMYFFTQICDLVGKKHGEIFLPVVECATEYIQKNWTKGDEHEPVPAYFSAPETLQNRTFSKCTEAWMVVATFYSVLLYGRQPFQELAHLKVSDFVKEIISYHSAENPGLFDQDLWEIVSCNFEYEPSKRKLVDQLLKDLEAFKVNLGVKNNFIYSVKSICSYINPEDIQKGYVDNEGNFIFENHEDLPPEIYEDYCETRESDCSYQTVQVKMNLNTRKKLKRLNQANIMRVQEILNGPYKTILVSNLDNYRQTLEELHTDLDRITLLLYLRQLTIALEELHSKNIVHCDLRSRHVYINQEQNTLKLGYLGRAVSLKGNHIIKMMPSEAKKWSAPEVQANGMYSRASDIFALAIVFWEVLSTNKYIRQLRLLKPFQKCESHMDIDFTFPRSPCTQDHIYKLVECMVECWNPNPIKRPKLSNIKQVIDELSNGYMTSRTEIIHEPSDDDDDDDADDEEQYQYQCSDDDDAMVGVAEEEESEDSESEFPIYAKFIS
ncbi:insulin-like growth factor 1 receptor [Pelobates cultripes]|uniref:Insulin-like growth factor 1 receptor n=1 Tax=Pelobates cultripes TaxID=61616 RepID=A0AAD1T9A3_PELCU|nr:insulin-like growth factor 1 receptor [Pelobates cultripes]